VWLAGVVVEVPGRTGWLAARMQRMLQENAASGRRKGVYRVRKAKRSVREK
jgi:hypothetical protein